MTKKNGQMRLKFEYEDIPILDMKQRINEEQLDNVFRDLKHKIFGR